MVILLLRLTSVWISGIWISQDSLYAIHNCLCAGTYSVEGSSQCTPCPVGHFCPNTSLDDVRQCPQGMYALGTEARCMSCPAGWHCPSTDGSGNAVCLEVSYIHG